MTTAHGAAGRPGRSLLLPAVVSLAIIATLVGLAEPATFGRALAAASWPGLAAGFMLFQGEGVLSALRLRRLAAPGRPLRACMLVTAWWVAALVVLPARLGELAGLAELRRRLGENLGQALNNLFVQRLHDGFVLLVFGTAALLPATGAGPGSALLTAVLAAVVLLVLWRLPWCFTLLARVLLGRFRRRRLRRVLQVALHARRAARRSVAGRAPLVLLGLSTAKWALNLGGIACVLLALLPALPAAAAVVVAVAQNLAALLPLAALGGMGAGDAAVAGTLAWQGVPLAGAAVAALGLRAVLIVAPLVFFAVVVVADRLWPEVRHAR